ncbi:WYL domain-containing protein [Amphibiibacter pelophylacis]|uniref:WYL domain-containing protein n=1 Tax=Amphibiibacter pelophylacis TaxID=1799477 RepID=A0ACC6P0T2_9BURK
MSTSKATQLLASEVQTRGDLLRREGYLVRKQLGAKPPPCASMKDLLEKLDAGLTRFADTGLRDDELPVNTWHWTDNMPHSEEVLARLVSACVNQRSVQIQYVGMQRGDAGHWLRIVPLSLDKMGDQWRLAAQDLEKEGAVRTYVLARILAAEHDDQPIPRKFVRASPGDSQKREAVRLNPGLTDVQRRVLARELRIKDGYVTLPARCWHEFMIRFADGQRSDNIAWPPLLSS